MEGGRWKEEGGGRREVVEAYVRTSERVVLRD